MPRPSATFAQQFRAGARAGILSVLAVCTLGLLIAACGTSASPGQSAHQPTTATIPPSTNPGSTIPGSQSGVRLPPIIYRPAGLSRATKVPLVIALHGGGASPVGPQQMEGLTHFEELANQDRFVVAFLDSSSQTNPWNPRTNDLAYVSSMIGQLKASQNVDPQRVYVVGFSAGGNETWLAACDLSNKVAAIAVVAYDMRPALYDSCRPSRPVSELLMIGDNDGIRFTGVPGHVVSASEAAAKWRALDGCAANPVSTQQVSTVVQQTWNACTDGSAVALYVIKGGGHDWPPIGAGSPTDYSASAAIWAFFSAHRATPTSISSDAKLTAPPGVHPGAKRTLMSDFHLGEPVAVQETLLAGHRSVATHAARLAKGSSKLAWLMPGQLQAGRYLLRMVLQDAYGRRLTVSRTVDLPSPSAAKSNRVTHRPSKHG
jgi:polyhydroxybutyrate depolymerase